MSKEELKLPTETEIKEWKSKHKDVHELNAVLSNDEKTYKAFVRKPKLKDMEHALSMRAKKGDIQMMKTLYDNCVLWEDPEIRQNDDLYGGIILQMGDLVTFAETTIKKL